MNKSENKIAAIFILLEILLGVTGGILYTTYGITNDSLFQSIVDFIVWFNTIFFLITVSLGIISAILLKKINRIFISVVCSLMAGLATFILLLFLNPAAPFFFLSLPGFILGFNLALLKNRKVSPGNLA